MSSREGKIPVDVSCHVKITDHFLQQSAARMQPKDKLRLFSLLETGALFALALEQLAPGERGAVCTGNNYVVFCRDASDKQMLALLTVLDAQTASVIQYRRDTRFLNLTDAE